MKKFSFFLALAIMLTLGCKKDKEDGFVLSYDGPNQSGPILAPGYHETAVLFPSNETAKYQGKQLTSISFFMGVVPQKVEVIVYGEGTADAPGTELYRANVTSGIKTPEWNEHILSKAIDLTGDDIWLSIGLTHDQPGQSIGCDAGPRKPNGDWIFHLTDNFWDTFNAETGESVNWNIRGSVSE